MNLSLREKVVGFLVAIIALLGGGAYVTSFGSVTDGQAYNSTTTSSTYANTAYRAFLGSGVVGAIIIGDDPTAGYIKIWDATSTATSTYQGESPSGTYGRLIAQTAIDILEGDLPIEATVNYGLVIETQAGFNGIATVTYKR